jgi:hypothetical protein
VPLVLHDPKIRDCTGASNVMLQHLLEVNPNPPAVRVPTSPWPDVQARQIKTRKNTVSCTEREAVTPLQLRYHNAHHSQSQMRSVMVYLE